MADGPLCRYGVLFGEWQLEAGKGALFVQRKLEKLEFAQRRAIYPKKAFTARPWSAEFKTVAEGTGIKFRGIADWKPDSFRVMRLLLQNTQKPEQVGRAQSQVGGRLPSAHQTPPGRNQPPSSRPSAAISSLSATPIDRNQSQSAAVSQDQPRSCS